MVLRWNAEIEWNLKKKLKIHDFKTSGLKDPIFFISWSPGYSLV